MKFPFSQRTAKKKRKTSHSSGMPLNLRALRLLLDEVDPKQQWGGLRKVLTPEGHYLWLCEYHAKEYLT